MKNKLILLCISIAFLLTSCANESFLPRKREYVSADVTYSESTAQYAFRLDMDSAETEYARYFFEPSIKDKEREACIKTTDDLLSGQSLGGVVPEIYVFSQDRYAYRYVSDHRLYASLRDWTSVEYITDVLLAAYGESVHYGTAFGYADYLAEKQNPASSVGSFSMPSVPDILDLSYLCFDADFAASEDTAAARAIACDFVASYIAQYGEQAMSRLMTSHAAAIDALAAYYAEHGVVYRPSAVQYGYGGKSYDYIVYSEYGTFYIANDWVDLHAELNPLVTDGFLHADYSAVKAFFETNLKQMKQYRDLFGLDDDDHDLEIVFPKAIGAAQNSFYQSADHRIYLYNVDSLMHEYIHALTKPAHTMSSWKVEGFARYFSYYYDVYGMALLNRDYNNTPNTPELKYIHEYSAKINRPIDIAKDYPELENIAVYSRSWTDPDENYVTGSSFVQYLVKQYGEEAVIDFIYGSGDPLPQTYLELVKAWNEYIEANYKAYSKYK